MHIRQYPIQIIISLLGLVLHLFHLRHNFLFNMIALQLLQQLLLLLNFFLHLLLYPLLLHLFTRKQDPFCYFLLFLGALSRYGDLYFLIVFVVSFLFIFSHLLLVVLHLYYIIQFSYLIDNYSSLIGCEFVFDVLWRVHECFIFHMASFI